MSRGAAVVEGNTVYINPFDSNQVYSCRVISGDPDDERCKASKSVVTCSLTDLLPPQSLGARLHTLSLADKTGVWRQARDLPITFSTLTTLGGHLLAIGGRDDSHTRTAVIRCYNTRTDSWHVVSQMKSPRFSCLAPALPEDRLVVVGGFTTGFGQTNSLEIGHIP